MTSPLRSDPVALSSYLVGTHHTVYAVHSLLFALPYFASLRSTKHRIYANVRQNSLLKKIKEEILSLLILNLKTYERSTTK